MKKRFLLGTTVLMVTATLSGCPLLEAWLAGVGQTIDQGTDPKCEINYNISYSHGFTTGHNSAVNGYRFVSCSSDDGFDDCVSSIGNEDLIFCLKNSQGNRLCDIARGDFDNIRFWEEGYLDAYYAVVNGQKNTTSE